MESHQRLKFGYIGILLALLLWVAIGLVFSIFTWFEPAPPGTMKMDALEEIAMTASILNIALPITLIAVISGFHLAKKNLIPMATPIVFSILFLGFSGGAIYWWNHMDDAHGPNISLTRNHLWWLH